MPVYDFRCKQCEQAFSLRYTSVAHYSQATPTCPHCQSAALSRLIRDVNVAVSEHDYTRMSANEMLTVFESGDSKQVGKMFDQIGGTNPALGAPYHDATQRLLKGESMDSVERQLQNRQASGNSHGESTESISE